MTAIIPETDIPIKTLEFGPNVVAESTDGAGAIVILIDLEGIRSVQLIAQESTEEEALRDRLTAAWPALELIQRTIQALNADYPVEAGK